MKPPKKYSKKAHKIVRKYAIGGETETIKNDEYGNQVTTTKDEYADLPQDAASPSPFAKTPKVQTTGLATNPVSPMTTEEYAAGKKPKGGGLTGLGGGGAYTTAGNLAAAGVDKYVTIDDKTGKGVVGKEIGKDALRGAGIGATIGSAVPIVGTAIGAGLGAAIGAGVGLVEGKKKKKAIQAETANDLQAENAAGAGGAYGFKKGGKVSYSAKKAAKGEDIGKTGKNFDKIADKAAKKYGSKEAGERVAGAILKNLRGKKEGGMIKNATQNRNPFKADGGMIGVPLGGGIDATKGKEKKLHFAEGGKIVGKGTGKSDSIPMEAKQGDFIVPVEMVGKAKEWMIEDLGYDPTKKKAKKDGGKIDIMVSDGEIHIPSEEVAIMKAKGRNMSELAPNAEEAHKKADGGTIENVEQEKVMEELAAGYEDGGEVEGYAKGTTEDGVQDKNPNIIEPSTFEEEQNKTIAEMVKKETKEEPHVVGGIADVKKVEKGSKEIVREPPAGKKIFDALGGVSGIASLGQTGLGLAQLYGRKRPAGSVDAGLLKQQAEALRESQTGLSEAEKALARQDIENIRRGDVKNIVGLSGGNTGAALANIGTAGTRAQRGLLDLGVRDARMKMAKQGRADQLTGAVAGAERQLIVDELNAFNQNQQSAAALTQAGLSNFFGNLSAQKAAKDADERAKKYGNVTVINSPYSTT